MVNACVETVGRDCETPILQASPEPHHRPTPRPNDHPVALYLIPAAGAWVIGYIAGVATVVLALYPVIIYMAKAQERDKRQVDSIDVSQDREPCTLFTEIEAASPSHASNQEALNSYSRELEILASKYQLDIPHFLSRCHESAGQFNADFERALSLSKRIAFLKDDCFRKDTHE